jgi:hypothetical protein
MIGKLTLSAAAIAATLIAAPVMAQNAPPVGPAGVVQKPGVVPPINPSAYAAIDNIRNQYMAARDNYLKVQAAELAARANLDRATNALLSVLTATVSKPPVPPMPTVIMQPPPQGQPPQGQPPRP